MSIEILSLNLGILTRSGAASVPQGLEESRFFSVLRTPEEISVVAESILLEGSLNEEDCLLTGWTAFRFVGESDFLWSGTITRVTELLAKADINIYSLPSSNTDYILIHRNNEAVARKILAEDFQVESAHW